MYNLNPLMRNVLITNEEAIFHAPTKHTLDPRTIQQAIIIAEERFVRPAIGDDLYDVLITAKNTEVTAANKATLQASITAAGDGLIIKEGDVVNAMEFLSANNLILWKQHLWKLTAECVLLTAIPDAFVQFGSEGVVHTSPPAGPMTTAGVNTPELRSVKWTMDKKLMDRIDPLLEALHAWFCKVRKTDASRYPLYKKDCDCDVHGVAYKRKTSWVMGLYDDIDNPTPRCCE